PRSRGTAIRDTVSCPSTGPTVAGHTDRQRREPPRIARKAIQGRRINPATRDTPPVEEPRSGRSVALPFTQPAVYIRDCRCQVRHRGGFAWSKASSSALGQRVTVVSVRSRRSPTWNGSGASCSSNGSGERWGHAADQPGTHGPSSRAAYAPPA